MLYVIQYFQILLNIIIIIWISFGMDQINYLFICRCCVCWMLNFSSSFKIWIIIKRFTILNNVSHLLNCCKENLWHVACRMSHASSNSPALTKFQLPIQFKPLTRKEDKVETSTEITKSNLLHLTFRNFIVSLNNFSFCFIVFILILFHRRQFYNTAFFI